MLFVTNVGPVTVKLVMSSTLLEMYRYVGTRSQVNRTLEKSLYVDLQSLAQERLEQQVQQLYTNFHQYMMSQYRGAFSLQIHNL